jgi:hypothetical protein
VADDDADSLMSAAHSSGSGLRLILVALSSHSPQGHAAALCYLASGEHRSSGSRSASAVKIEPSGRSAHCRTVMGAALAGEASATSGERIHARLCTAQEAHLSAVARHALSGALSASAHDGRSVHNREYDSKPRAIARRCSDTSTGTICDTLCTGGDGVRYTAKGNTWTLPM